MLKITKDDPDGGGKGYTIWDETGCIQYHTPVIAIAFDEEWGCLLKWGKPDTIKAWKEKIRDVPELYHSVTILESSEISEEDIMKALEISGHIGRLYKEQLKLSIQTTS